MQPIEPGMGRGMGGDVQVSFDPAGFICSFSISRAGEIAA